MQLILCICFIILVELEYSSLAPIIGHLSWFHFFLMQISIWHFLIWKEENLMVWEKVSESDVDSVPATRLNGCITLGKSLHLSLVSSSPWNKGVRLYVCWVSSPRLRGTLGLVAQHSEIRVCCYTIAEVLCFQDCLIRGRSCGLSELFPSP